MDKDKLVELAERCEAANGPDRNLDLDIAFAMKVEGCGYTDRRNDDGSFTKINIVGPLFTASLDAAMTLVPEGKSRSVRKDCDGCISFVWGDIATGVRGEAATEPLALCAAALRSHAQPK